jgi:hydroxyacylglutathione hydrolase
VAAVCDPIEDTELYVRIADENGMKIRYVIDTHIHADHVSGARRLAAVTGAEYVLHAEAPVAFEFRPAKDNDQLDLANVQIGIVHTPGHTPEHISLLVTDRSRSKEPWLLMSGHTLMVGDMGRTELVSDAVEGARAMFHSAQRLKTLSDYVEVLPGAYSGSVCGRSLSGKPMSTIGFERKFNVAFQIADEDAFVRHMLANIPAPPAAAAKIRAINLGQEPARE